MDTFLLKSERTRLHQFIKTEQYGLIQSGTHSLEIIKNIRSIEIGTNIPSAEKLPVFYYNITIFNGSQIIFSETVKGKHLNKPSIIKALGRLKRGGMVEVYNIKAKTPWDDGQQPQHFLMCVK